MSYRVPQFIAFNHADPAGIAFFGNIITIAHQSIEQFIIHKGIKWNDWYKSTEYGAPIRSVKTNFKKPVLPGRTYDFKVDLERIGTSSLDFKISVLDQENSDHIHAVVEINLVFVAVIDGKVNAREIPEKLKDFLK